jgi:hypothetical protein
MLTASENVTEGYFRDADFSLPLTNSRPALAYVRVMDLPKLPDWISLKTDLAQSADDTTAPTTAVPKLDTSPNRADTAIAQLLRLAKFDADWDGSEAAKPLDYSINEARRFIRLLSPESIIPRATLHADGHAILFVREPDLYAEIEFLGNNKIGFYTRRGDKKWSDEFSFDGRSLPDGLSRIGFSL